MVFTKLRSFLLFVVQQ